MVIIEGNHKCNSSFHDCDNEYEWMAVVSQNVSLPIYEVETIDKLSGEIIEITDEQYVVSAICPKCHQGNIIGYKRTE